MLKPAALAGALLVLTACAGYCPVDHSGLEAPALWSGDAQARTAAADHVGTPFDGGPR